MSIMSFRLFVLSVLLATAFAQSTTSRRHFHWSRHSRYRHHRTRTLRPTGGFYPTGGLPTGGSPTGGYATGELPVPTSAAAPVIPSSDVPSYTRPISSAPVSSVSTVVVTTVVTTPLPSTVAPTTAVPTTLSTVAPTAAAPPPATTSKASSISSYAPAPSSPSGDGSKKGLSFTDPSVLTPWAGKGVGWTYNWWTTRGNVPKEMDYFPMMWCPTKLSVKAWEDAANTAISQGSTRILGFNEPDQTGQCDITYQAAAEGHMAYMNQFKGKAKIGSPAVTNGGGQMGLTYQENFLNACNGNCSIDFLNMHWYGNKQNAVYNFQLQVNKTIALGEKFGINEVYVTEFGMNDGTAQDKADFLNQVLPWMDGMAKVGGYAYFMCSDGSLMSGSTISPVLGAAYATA